MLRAAGLASMFLGVGFGLPAVYGARRLAQTGEVWTFLGFPTYGGGPFENAGIRSTPLILTAFALVCAAEIVVGALLWFRRRSGVVGSLVLLPFEFLFWIGFALPFGPPVGVLRTVLAVVGRRSVHS